MNKKCVINYIIHFIIFSVMLQFSFWFFFGPFDKWFKNKVSEEANKIICEKVPNKCVK